MPCAICSLIDIVIITPPLFLQLHQSQCLACDSAWVFVAWMNENHSDIDMGSQSSVDLRPSEHKECFYIFFILCFTRLSQSTLVWVHWTLGVQWVYGGGGKTATPEVLKIFLSQFLPKLRSIHLDFFFYVCTHAKSLQSCLTLGDSKGHHPRSIGSSRQYWVVAMPSSKGSSQPRDRTHMPCISCICR